MVYLARTRQELKAAREKMSGSVALVMTMGALHEGHMALVREAKARCKHVIVSIYVNPLQFGPGEDYEAYPRTLEADLALLEAEGVSLVFAPSDSDVYPREPLVRIDPGPVATCFEGRTRPTHFAGVLQIVCKVLLLTRPDVAIFGQKDAQQLALITTMVSDLNIPVEIVPVPIQREATGLALSSRNVYLSAEERQQAHALSYALREAAELFAGGADVSAVRSRLIAQLEASEGVRLDYAELVDPRTFLPAAHGDHAALAIVAAWVGTTRLIDNWLCEREEEA